jgi:phosphoribosylformimino-5-aminoimidazole carboxamide ribotide isomerase
MAVKEEATFSGWLQKYGADKFLLGADVKEEKITITGWTQQTEIWIYDFIQQYIEKGITQLFCTDVAKDGALEGPSLELYKNIIQKFPGLYFIASGGVSGIDDVHRLKDAGCSGVIIGKAIYEGRIHPAPITKAE